MEQLRKQLYLNCRACAELSRALGLPELPDPTVKVAFCAATYITLQKYYVWYKKVAMPMDIPNW